MKWFFSIIFLAAVGLFIANSPYDSKRRTRHSRAALTQNASTPLEIAIVWPANTSVLFVEGAELAAEQINKRGGITIANESNKLVKTFIKLLVFDEPEDGGIEKFARQIATDPNLTAVIGHSRPDSAVRASVTYEDNGLMFVSPSVSDPRLNEHGFRLAFQTIPDDQAITGRLIEFGLKRGWKRAAILYVRNTYGTTYERLLRENMDNYFLANTTNTNDIVSMQLVHHDYYTEDSTSFYLLIAGLLEKKFDVVILGDSTIGASAPRTIALISQLREMGVNQPILGSEELNLIQLWDGLGTRANNIFTAHFFDYRSPTSPARPRQFAADFATRFNKWPTTESGEAYEAVQLVAQAAERARSKLPIRMAIMFKSTDHWYGLQGDGNYSFALDGSIRGKKVSMAEMRSGNVVWSDNSTFTNKVTYSNSFDNLNPVEAATKAEAASTLRKQP